MGNCFEDSAELAGFFQENRNEIYRIYIEMLQMERQLDARRQKSIAYAAVKDYLHNKKLIPTDCQVTRMAELLLFTSEAEPEEQKKEQKPKKSPRKE